jgi:hypothetical protein
VPLALAVAAGASGCSLNVPDRPITIDLQDHVERPEQSVVIFFPDALDRRKVDDLVAAGRLPAIREHFVDGGVGVTHAISSMPSITYPNCSSIITGVFPGHHGILGNFWFDRNTLECRYYMTYDTYRTVNQHLARPTMYDVIPERFTLNIQGHTRRGVTQTIDNERMFAWSWVFGRYTAADRYVGLTLEEAAGVANHVGRWPSIIMTYYPGVDEVGHRCGPDSEEYARALINIDGVVGHVTDAIERAGLGDSTWYVLVGDHGMAPVDAETRIDLIDWLRRDRGMRVRNDPISRPEYVDRLDLINRYDAVAAVDAGRVCMIHLRGERGWPWRPPPEEVRRWIFTEPSPLELPAVEVVLMRAGSDAARVLSRRGEARIERRSSGGGPEYRIARYEGDPLGYAADPSLRSLVAGEWRTSRDWLRSTAGARFPDLVPQVVEMFDSPRTGDVVLMAAEGWNFYDRELGGHGSCLARDMHITLYFSGPGLPGGATIPCARLVDVMPTVLTILGEQSRLTGLQLDGVSLWNELQAASSQSSMTAPN